MTSVEKSNMLCVVLDIRWKSDMNVMPHKGSLPHPTILTYFNGYI